MKNGNKNMIGVIGGMGPQASCEFYRLPIEGARLHHGARNNDEFIIRGVLAGDDRGFLMRKLVKIVERYKEKEKIGGIVLGCTELPLVFPANYDLPVYNSLSILANSVLRRYYGGRHE